MALQSLADRLLSNPQGMLLWCKVELQVTGVGIATITRMRLNDASF